MRLGCWSWSGEGEIFALEEKALNPDKIVLCPRCGSKLQYREVGNSYEVKCLSTNCICETVRGL